MLALFMICSNDFVSSIFQLCGSLPLVSLFLHLLIHICQSSWLPERLGSYRFDISISIKGYAFSGYYEWIAANNTTLYSELQFNWQTSDIVCLFISGANSVWGEFSTIERALGVCSKRTMIQWMPSSGFTLSKTVTSFAFIEQYGSM